MTIFEVPFREAFEQCSDENDALRIQIDKLNADYQWACNEMHEWKNAALAAKGHYEQSDRWLAAAEQALREAQAERDEARAGVARAYKDGYDTGKTHAGGNG